ncbi:MAG: hypothetical protein MZV63_11045 [Marinilabiliales bacterium]|nr:hypothetical protein [Marinilabiliales bacterium]
MSIYSWFYFSIYALALVGGILADSTKKYKLVILAGIIIMFAGYIIMAVPGMTLTITIIGLFTIALGNGLFKGNLQAVVGQMYDDPKYSKLRDSAYHDLLHGYQHWSFVCSICCNRNEKLVAEDKRFCSRWKPAITLSPVYKRHPYRYSGISAACKQCKSMNGPVTDLAAFAGKYLEVFSKGYNYAFGIAAGAMVLSLLVYMIFNKLLPNKEKESD